MNTNDVIDTGLRGIREEYWATVRAVAEEILADFPEDDDDRQTAIHEFADGSQWVIYPREAYLVALVSNNADAHEDAIDIAETARGAVATLDGMVTTAAYFAMRADIEEQIAYLNRIETMGQNLDVTA